MTHLGLFSGIGGFEEAFRRAGATLSAVCEIDPKAQSVLRRHFPEAEIIKDVKEVTKERYPIKPDIITGGFPCQDLSVAGRRAGLDGERSGLWFEYLRIITEYQPRWVVIENVPGLLSSNGGRDFAIILRGLVECGYGVAWRILDAQYFGLAQRRQRVFIVASRGDGRAVEVLFEREGGAWDSPPRREAGEGIASTIRSGATMRSAGAGQTANGMPVNFVGFGLIGNGEYANRPATIRSKGGDCGGGSEHLIAGTLAASGAGTERPAGQCNELDFLITAFGGNREERAVSTALSSRNERYDFETETFIAHTLRAEGFDASEDGTGRGTPLIAIRTAQTSSNGHGFSDDLSYTLDGTQGQCIAGQPGVRRLMPVECEILQGFPRNWTAVDDAGKPISDSARYRMLGNAVAVPVVEWIARRIMKADAE